IRDNDPDAHEPVIVSLGPSHHHKRHLQAMIRPKWNCLRKFLGRNHGMTLEDYLKMIKENELDPRMAYSEEVSMSSDESVQMMLHDCSFVVATICFSKEKVGGLETVQNPIRSTSWALRVVEGEMLILENQLPFFLLQTLFQSTCPDQPDLLEEQTHGFLSRTFMDSKMKLKSDIENFDHFLRMIHSCISPQVNRDGGEPSTSLRHILNRMRTPFSNHSAEDKKGTEHQPTPQLEWIPNATQLLEAGVQFKRNEQATSFLDVTFRNGEMEIPLLEADDDTNTLFRNLIAFE
ncbi:unnamed protein product, partial [Musa textilis]